MAAPPTVDDLTLVKLIAETGSIGAAARGMLLSQPSASARLNRLERRLGVELFERTARGATPTHAGTVLCRHADHILGHLERVVDEVRAATAEPPLRIGCFHGIADTVLPILDAHSGSRQLLQRVDHGIGLIEWVAEGSLDAAVVSIAEQLTLPAQVVAHEIGRDDMVVLVPAAADRPRGGRTPLKGLQVPTTTYDLRREELARRIVALGGVPRFGATVTGTIRMARLSAQAAIVPRSAALAELRPDDSLVDLPFHWDLRLSLVTRGEPSSLLLELAAVLNEALGLTTR